MATSSATPKAYTGKAHELVPEFGNKATEYKEYRKRVMLYERKMYLSGRQKETAFNLMSTLSGRAWSAVEDLSITDLEAEDGTKKLLERLDTVFKYDALTELPYDFETFFFHTYRRRTQTVQEYCADYEKQLRKLDQHGVTLPDKVVGWFFLRRAGLRQDQRQMIMSTLAAEKISLETVRKAVNFVIGQDAIPQGSTMTSPVANKYGRHGSTKDSMFFEDEADEEVYALQDDAWDDLEDAYAYQEDDDDAVYYEDYTEEVVGSEEAAAEFDDIYAAYTDARQRMNQMRVSRGFYPVVAMMPESKDFGGKGKKGNHKGKKGKGKSVKGKFSQGKQSPKPPSAVARGKAVFGSSEKCLRCGGYGHRAKACPHANKRKAENQDAEAEILMVGEEDPPSTMEVCMHEDDGTESEPDDTAIWDSGAASVLVSRFHLRKYLKALMMKGFDIHTIKAWQCTKGFKFGNGNQDKTNLCVLLPTFFRGARRDIVVYVIGGKVQFLFGRPLLEKLGIAVDHHNKTMRWPDEDWKPIPLGPKGEYVLHLAEHMHLVKEKYKVNQTLIPEDFDEHVQLDKEVKLIDIVNNRDLEENYHLCEYGPVPDPNNLQLPSFVDGTPRDEVETEKVRSQKVRISGEDEIVTNEDVLAVPEDGERSPTKDPKNDEGRWKKLTPQKLRTLTNCARSHVKNVERMMAEAPQSGASRTMKVWEVFAGKGRVTQILNERYPQVDATRFSLLDGWDFQDPNVRRRFLAKLRREEPDSLLLSPPCRLWSPLQELTAAKGEEFRVRLMKMREEDHDTILTFCAVAYEEQRRNGRDATCEHPWGSKAWKTKAFCKMKGHDTYVDQCQYKLRLPDDDGVVRPVRKPTCFRTTGATIRDRLWATCSEGHQHTPLEGNIAGVGARSKLAESYPPMLASTIAEAIVAQFNAWDEVNAAEEEEEAGGDQDLSPLHDEEGEKVVEMPEHVVKNRELRRKVGRRAFEYVQRLHKNLGHVTPEVLAKMLGEVLATDDVIKAAKEYTCPTCYARKKPAQVPPGSALKTTEFNQRLQVDTHWILCEESSVREREPAPGTPAARRKERGELSGRQCVMTIVDHATRYCAVRILKAETAEEFTKEVERCWFKHFGTPKILRIDEAKGWSSKHVREWASSRSIAIEVQPAEQHSWLGVVERKHQVVRRALELYQDDIGRHDLSALKEAAIYVPHTINQMEMVKGFTPQQWVLGKTMTNVHGLTSEIFNPGQEALDDAGAFAQVQQKRVSAQIAWIKADTDAKLRRAFNQKFIDVKEAMVVGQRCWYWRVAGSGILHKAKWRGPARVVAIEEHDSARVVWVCHGTSLVRCSERQVRPLVEETGTEVVVDHKAALKDLEELKARSTTQFKDELQADGGPEMEWNEDPIPSQDEGEGSGYDPTTPGEEVQDPDDLPDYPDVKMSELPGVVSMMLPPLLEAQDRERTPRRNLEDAEMTRRRSTLTVSTETEVPETPLFDNLSEDEEAQRRRSPKRKVETEGSQRRTTSRRRREVEAGATSSTIPTTTSETVRPNPPPQELHSPEQSAGIPIPEETEDDGLSVDVLVHEVHGQLPEGWRCVEGEIEMEDAYYAAVRKGEVNQRTLTISEREQFIDGKKAELEQYFTNNVWEFATPNEGQKAERAGRVITARWVLTWKKIEAEGAPDRWKAKARLVLRGFEDPDLLSIQKAAPTASRLSRTLLLATAQWLSWDIMCGDVKTAFLSGKEFSREIVVRLPADCSALLGADAGPCYMRMRKSAYGLADAPLLWYQEADRRLKLCGWIRHPIDQCCYLLIDYDEKKVQYMCAMLILHVDDILIGGEAENDEFKEAIKKLKKHFNFGKWDQLSGSAPIKYCGGTIIRGREGLELSYEEYMRKVCPMTVQKTRKAEDKIQEGEMSKARGLIGALQWPSTQGMPALAASVSIQAGELAGGSVQTLHDLNKTLRFAKNSAQVRLKFLAKDEDGEGIKGLTAVMFADAAFDVRKDHSSQGGYILLVGSRKVLEGNKCPMSTVSWRSFKLPRVCRSSLAAECQSLSSSLEELMMVKAFLAKMQRPEVELKVLKDDLKQECAVITDCKALYDCIKRETIQQATDKRVTIEALVIKDLLKDLACQWRWISSERQLADGLTKIGARQSFIERYKGGYVQLVADETYTAAKKKTKEQRERTLQEPRFKVNSSPGTHCLCYGGGTHGTRACNGRRKEGGLCVHGLCDCRCHHDNDDDVDWMEDDEERL